MSSETLSTIHDPRSFLCTIAKRVMVDSASPKRVESVSGDAGAYAGGGSGLHLRNAKASFETLQLVDSMLDG